MLTKEEFEEIRDAHQNETWWYLFLNYGCPIENSEYEEKFNNVSKAVEEYTVYMSKQAEVLGVPELDL